MLGSVAVLLLLLLGVAHGAGFYAQTKGHRHAQLYREAALLAENDEDVVLVDTVSRRVAIGWAANFTGYCVRVCGERCNDHEDKWRDYACELDYDGIVDICTRECVLAMHRASSDQRCVEIAVRDIMDKKHDRRPVGIRALEKVVPAVPDIRAKCYMARVKMQPQNEIREGITEGLRAPLLTVILGLMCLICGVHNVLVPAWIDGEDDTPRNVYTASYPYRVVAPHTSRDYQTVSPYSNDNDDFYDDDSDDDDDDSDSD